MKKFGGNISGMIQIKSGHTKNKIGESIPNWVNAIQLNGFLDYSSGDSKNLPFDTKVQESTHIFLADYVELPSNVKSDNSRMIINGKKYDVLVIDNPMEMNYHWEIYLKFNGDLQ